MKTKHAIYCLFFLLFIQSCSKKSAAEFNSNFSTFKTFVTNFSGGLISAQSDLRVVLAFQNDEWKKDEVLDSNLFSISPSVDGKVVALSSSTIAFIPAKKLKSDTEYQVTLHLSKLIETPKELEDFNFTVKTIKQDFIVTTADVQSYSPTHQYLNASFKTADKLDFETASKLITAEQNGKKLKLKFETSSGSASEFKFIIDSLQRYDSDTTLKIRYDGNSFDIDQKGSIDYSVKGKNNFTVVDASVSHISGETLLLNFSDPLAKDQDFDGLVSIDGARNLKYAVQGNLLKVFFESSATGELLVEVFQGIENEYGAKMKNTYREKVLFDQLKPNVRFLKNGIILPSSNNLKLNFETVNLKAVDVKVYKIYTNTILQFLQENELNGSRNLKKVAQPVAKKTINLKQNNLFDTSKWNTYALDLSTLITPAPGAMYRVEISFKRGYSLYNCSSSDKIMEDEEVEEVDEKDVNYSNSGDNYYDDYYEGYYDYDWRQSQDPCSESYFYNAVIGTNVLASDLGVIAKRGENKSYFFAVNNIVNTDPVSGATIDLYNFQQQKLTSLTTNSDGFAEAQLDTYAYFAIVTRGQNTTYVKLDDGTSLSVSNFDVSGEVLQKGLKGYIYGERGVWRPGDPIYLSFILDDTANPLPANHPIQLRISDPRGKVAYQTVKKTNTANHYVFKFSTNEESPTGNWEARISVGGAKFYKSLKVETIKPNRLKIKNSFQKEVLSSRGTNTNNLQVNWLHGAVAKNLKVEVQAKFSQQVTTFKNYTNYDFDDEVRKFSTEEINLFSGKLNESGQATISIEPKLTAQAPGFLKAAVITKVYEEGGDVSTDVFATTYSPYETYVGIKSPEPNKYGMLETGKSNRFEVQTVNENGSPKSVSNLEVRVYKVEWRWWWDASDDNLSNFSSSDATTSYKSFTISTNAAGKGSFQFEVPENDWGRYLIRVSNGSNGHATAQTVLIDWPYWSGKTKDGNASSANMLVFATDKKKYNVGEKAMISFPSSEGGRALISIENGTKVLRTIWVDTKKGETKAEIPLTKDMAPNVYFNVTLLQPHATTKNDSPIRMYGVTAIEVLDPNSKLEPVIKMPNVLKPEQKFTVNVSEKNGQPMTYSIAVVDEGLLDLTRFKTPNAWDSFYARAALGVKTWDVYDDIIGAYGGKVNQIFAIGGDQSMIGGKAKKANRFKPVVLYYGPFVLEKGKATTHTLQLPKYVGSVRTMVVAASTSKSAYGAAEKTTPVRSPLMVLASLPRKISPGERVRLPVTIFTTEGKIKNVNVSLKMSKGLRVVGSATQNISFTAPDEKMAYFDIEVGEATGIEKIEVIASSGSEKASFAVEIDLINPNPITNDYQDYVIEPNSSKKIDWATFGTRGSNLAKLEISSMPTIDINRRLQYLIQYPHGCLEQTTSGVFPQLYLADIVDMTSTQKANTQKNVTAGITRISNLQASNGGFMYWPGARSSDDWATSYAGHFLIEAEKKGYVLPVNLKSKWLSFQKSEARKWRFIPQYGNDLAQAYRLYTLALAGSADLASMNRLRETVDISNEAKLRLAAAYVLSGQKSTGKALLANSTIAETADRYSYYYYGSEDRNRAMALETLILLGEKQKAFRLANILAKQMSSDQWMSTQTTAYSLYAMSLFAKSNGESGIGVEVSGTPLKETISSSKSIVSRNLAVKTGGNAVTIKNTKGNTIYVRLLNTGILPVGQEKTIQSDVSAYISYNDRKGNPISVESIKQGTEFIATITIRNQRNESVENVALTQIIPSGFEIVNTRYTDYGSSTDNRADYIDIRDDRANYYFGLKASESKTFTLLLNASYLGKYYMPGIQCEAMYDATFITRTKGYWIEVLP
ncbi:alpha-2-macroglobulin family protein [Flavobacterium tegetincola]|uniref:alpha-2-macroglobulin family protein n=1 Tax=Flavobacterium tegetincola TaxID=150172 RepID=UPI000420A6E2|nr:MG2 domain-containing protein [Flavobacterium tegetincola]